MIYDSIEGLKKLYAGKKFAEMISFVEGLDENTPDGEYEIAGRDIFAKIVSYGTKTLDEAVLESHRIYADIQVILLGVEKGVMIPADGLSVSKPYNEENDVEFYVKPERFRAEFILSHGFVAVFFPEDAHMTQLSLDGKSWARKAVLKVRAELLRS